jgi:CBS domain-containing protein
MHLKDIMSRSVEAVRPSERLDRAHRLMRLRGIHHLVVVDRHQVVGVLSEAVLQTREAEGVGRAEDAMFRHVVRGTPEMSVAQAAQLMRGRPEGALPVFEGNRLVGIVTISDLLDVLARRIERPSAQGVRTGRHRQATSA